LVFLLKDLFDGVHLEEKFQPFLGVIQSVVEVAYRSETKHGFFETFDEFVPDKCVWFLRDADELGEAQNKLQIGVRVQEIEMFLSEAVCAREHLGLPIEEVT
jgi:hypothetical protein